MIKKNGDRYCKNPYFLHSLCTSQGPAVAYTDHTSAYGSYKDNRTISQSGHKRNLRRNLAAESRASGIGDDGTHPPRIKKKQRPFSAPRHQGLRSLGLKNKIQNHEQQLMPRPGTQEAYNDMNN